jgi:hypothetical protein
VNYRATAPIDNSDLRLRPGMTFTARITVAEKENVLSVPSDTFKVTRHNVQQLTEELGYGYQPLDNKKLLEIAHNDTAKTLWILKDKTFMKKQ